jgi:hypothetical protein
MAVVLTGVLVWDGCGEEPAEAEFVVDDGRFDSAADMHVHLVWSGGPDPACIVEHAGATVTTLRTAADAQTHLLAGMATVRVVGSDVMAEDLPAHEQSGADVQR